MDNKHNKQGSSVPGGWNELAEMGRLTLNELQENQKRIEEYNRGRQYRKAIAGLLVNTTEEMAKVISERDVKIPQEFEQEVIEKIESGEIGLAKERHFIGLIRGPEISMSGLKDTMSKLHGKHELGILGMAQRGDEGFQHWEMNDANDLKGLLTKYPTPVEFESFRTKMVEDIGIFNGEKKRLEYEKAMDSFEQKVYGKQFEYWQRIKELNAEAAKRKGDQKTGAMVISALKSLAGKVKEKVGSTNEKRGAKKNEERNRERLYLKIGARRLARNQVRAGMAAMGEVVVDDSCEDSLLAEPNEQFFGVFDGMGGERGGREASRLAARLTSDYNRQIGGAKSERDLADILNQVNQEVRDTPNAGGSTATIAKINNENGRKTLLWASVGDSRLYIVNGQGGARQISRDEGEGRQIWNALGGPEKDECVRQTGTIALNKGDRVVLCSDGITGDFGEQLMSERELGLIVARAKTPDEAAGWLMASARKIDDRTVIVIEA
ncbi:SpoIIE family protein phosphatase [Candidatus Saccharibacteria bacterium]|nr:SpoIIE family protein phosphatase [Candidatus Saccharibacteria bacterium]